MEDRTSTYTNLDRNARQIRIARILPTSDISATVQCALDVISLDDETIPAFEALSYSWGDSSITADIQINGSVFAVTTNLEAALRQFREDADGQLVWIWIDAICINQWDLEERNSQVAMMREIYTKASNVRIWLGVATETDHPDMVCRVLRRIVNEPMAENGLEELSKEEHSTEMGMVILAMLFAYPYWGRRWIVQEVRSARYRTLHIGKHVEPLPGDVFAKVREYIRVQILVTLSQAFSKRRDETVVIDSDGLPKASMVGQAARALGIMLQHPQTVLAELNDKQQWHNFIRALKFSECTVEHDTIYAILGLLPDKLGMQIDYKLPIVDLLCEFTWRWIQHWQTLNLFYDVRNIDPALPSWVPELRHPQLRQSSLGPQALGPQAISPDTLCAGKFKAHAGATKSEMRRVDHYTIAVGAFIFDTIVAVGSEGPRDGSVLHRLTVRDAVEQNLPADWLEMYRKHCTAYPDEEECDIILRTFHMNQDRHVPPRADSARPFVGDSKRFKAMFGLLTKEAADGPFFTFFVTESGRCGMCIPDVKVGDKIAIIARLWMPFCLRAADDGKDGYQLLSSCYLHGVMDGEAVLSAVQGDPSHVNDVFEHIRII